VAFVLGLLGLGVGWHRFNGHDDRLRLDNSRKDDPVTTCDQNDTVPLKVAEFVQQSST